MQYHALPLCPAVFMKKKKNNNIKETKKSEDDKGGRQYPIRPQQGPELNGIRQQHCLESRCLKALPALCW